jgi:multiple sugar transport system ATP-binding protein
LPSVSIRNVSKIYARGQKAVDGVSLDIADAELLVLVGPSGCGKSTLLRMVAGLEEISSGEVRIGERIVNDVPPKDRDVAMVFQNYALYPHMTVRENLAFGLLRRKVPRPDVDRRVREVAEMLGIDRYLDRRPRELSGGERQRVALGRAMVREPQVFLFDEPLSNLDAQLRVQMRAEIKRLHHRLRGTMIYVTHDQVEAMTLGDRIAVLRAGVLQQVADPATLYNQPANAFVARFIGSPPINLFEATVEAKGADGAVLRSGEVSLPLPASLAVAARGHAGRPVWVGVRPEHIVLARDAEEGAFGGRVDVREPLGNEVLVHWGTPLGDLVARIPGQEAPQEGETHRLALAFDRLLLFDRETERSLGQAAPAAAARA